MKLKHLLTSAFLLVAAMQLVAQKAIPAPDSKEYNKQKANGTLPKQPMAFIGTPGGPNLLEKFNPSIKPSNSVQASTSCNCFQTIDNTFSIAPFTNGIAPEYRNDDGSTAQIALPFDFCLYGTTYNSLYINNNGNVSFGASYSTFTGNDFPDGSYVMVAPFWADVDTRNASSGLVYYKITSTSMIVRWQNVGYYSSQADKLNDFQLIITNGNDPILPIGSNVSFCYGDMQWTTGSASGGVGGFGGTAATVGVNKGDNSNFVQFGRFDHAGIDYDGPFGVIDGVSWLDYQSFFFNVCTNSNNIAPIVSGIAVCDTIQLCIGDQLPINFSFLSPEQTQTTSTVINSNGVSGFTGSSTSGNTSTVTANFTASNANIGFNTITFTATDDGTPAVSTTVTLVINVQPPPPLPTITGGLPFCPGGSTTITAAAGYQNYSWSPGGATTATINPSTAGTYTVTVDNGGCSVSASINVLTFPPASPVIVGPANICTQGVAVLTLDSLIYTSYSWTPGSNNNDTIVVGPGTYNVAVVDSNGCTGSDQFVLGDGDVVVTLTAPATTCFNAPVTITANTAPASSSYIYTWTPNISTDSVATGPSGQYIVVVTDPSGNCTYSDTITILNITPAVNITGNGPFCAYDSLLLSTDIAFSAYQWYADGQPILGNNFAYADSGLYTVVVTDQYGCQTSDTVLVDPPPLPVAAFTTNPPFGGVVLEPVQFTDQSTSPGDTIVGWQWVFGQPPLTGSPDSSNLQNPTSVFPVPSDSVPITLIVMNTLGCYDTLQTGIEIVPDIIPNVITPNGDSYNQYLVIPVTYVKPGCVLDIYNRWGRKVYHSDSYNNDWDGEGHTDGVYYYVFVEPDGKKKHGTVTILLGK